MINKLRINLREVKFKSPEINLDLRGLLKAKRITPTVSFNYIATDLDGLQTTGNIQAPSFGEAKLKLEHVGLAVVRLSIRRPWWEFEIGKVVPLKVVAQATRQLASFAQAGIPISNALEVLASSTEHKRMNQSLQELKMEIEGGTTFSEALRHQSNIYPIYFSAIISSAERTGDITEALETLNQYLDRDLRSSRAVKSAMFYPIVLSVLAIFAITIISVVVLPRFQVFFQTLGQKLPATTRALLFFTGFFSSWWWLMGTVAILIVASYLFASKKPKGKLFIDQTKLRLPLFGSLFQLVAVERFCRVLATLTKSKISLPEALEMAGSATGNSVFIREIAVARLGVINGEGLADPLGRSKIFPPVAIQIFKVGEESGQLDSQLLQASGFYSDELDFRLKNFTGLIEPIVLVVLGGGIGFVAVALISAMYGIYSGVQK